MTGKYLKVLAKANSKHGGEDRPDPAKLEDEGRLIWNALDSKGTFDELVPVHMEAVPDATEDQVRMALRIILDEFIHGGLVIYRLDGTLIKSEDVVTEEAVGELLVLHRDRPKVHVFNESSATLWEAIDAFQDLDSLTELALEAWDNKDPVETQRAIMVFVATLCDAGLVTLAESP